MKYQFIEQYKQEFPVVVMCRVLGVSESGYYAWRKRPQSRHQQEDARLTTQIQDVFVAFRGVYGSPRIHAELRDQGWHTSRKRIARLMQENGMDARRKPFRPVTTKRNPKHAVAPNLLAQDFTAERPNEKWTGDITYVPTAQGWLYLAVMLDVFSRRVIGWAMSSRCDELLVETALRMALARRRPEAGLLHHTAPRQSIHQSSVSAGVRGGGDHGEHERERQLLR